jgi:hypothetical protein
MAQIEDLDLNVLDEAVNEKSYSKPNITLSASDMNTPIGEPDFSPPPMDEPKKPRETAEQIREKKNPEPFNPEMKYIPKKEQNMAAEQMADMIFVGYGKLHDLANKGLQISPKKLNKLQNEGKINLNAMINYDFGSEIPARDFFAEYNEQNKDFFKLDPDWVDDVKPVLVRVLAKKGIGMTDENYLLFQFGQDLATKGFMFLQQRRQINEIIKSIGAATTSEFANPAPPPQQQQQENQPSEYTETMVEENDYDDLPKEPSFDNVEIVDAENNSQPLSPDMIILPKRPKGNAKGRKSAKK